MKKKSIFGNEGVLNKKRNREKFNKISKNLQNQY